MALTWTTVLEWARVIRKESEAQFRAEIAKHGITSQMATNWKNGRAIPIAQYPLFAQLFGKSTDELHGEKPLYSARDSTLVYQNSDDESKLLAAEISRLTGERRSLAITMINTLLAQQIREEKAVKQTAKPSQSKGKGKARQRPNA